MINLKVVLGSWTLRGCSKTTTPTGSTTTRRDLLTEASIKEHLDREVLELVKLDLVPYW